MHPRLESGSLKPLSGRVFGEENLQIAKIIQALSQQVVIPIPPGRGFKGFVPGVEALESRAVMCLFRVISCLSSLAGHKAGKLI